MQQHILEHDVTSYQGKWGKKGLLDCLDSFFSFSKINTKIERCQERDCGETTHIPQESNSTSLLTGKSYHQREALIENSNTPARTNNPSHSVQAV